MPENTIFEIIVFIIKTYKIENFVPENTILKIIIFIIKTYEIENFMSENIIFKIIIFIIKTFKIQIDLNFKHVMFNDIIVYNISKMIIQIVSIIDEFFKI